jgi:hypothetical protein
MHTLKAGVLSFTLVFGAGFVLDPMRILCLVPLERFTSMALEIDRRE